MTLVVLAFLGAFISGPEALAHRASVVAVSPNAVLPTQSAVGYLWVDEKVKKFSRCSPKDLDRKLRQSPPEAVRGPGGRIYLLDNHHEFYAFIEMGVPRAYVRIIADFSRLTWPRFKERMTENGWVYGYDENGRPGVTLETLPSTIASMHDDPYRSLASMIRKAGGFEKVPILYSEFRWANALRSRVSLRLIIEDIDRAVSQGVKFAHSKEAKGLPGYIGDCEDLL